jgi:hypothetical protein
VAHRALGPNRYIVVSASPATDTAFMVGEGLTLSRAYH